MKVLNRVRLFVRRMYGVFSRKHTSLGRLRVAGWIHPHSAHNDRCCEVNTPRHGAQGSSHLIASQTGGAVGCVGVPDEHSSTPFPTWLRGEPL